MKILCYLGRHRWTLDHTTPHRRGELVVITRTCTRCGLKRGEVTR